MLERGELTHQPPHPWALPTRRGLVTAEVGALAAREEFKRGRCGQRNLAMGGVGPAGTKGKRGGVEFGDAEVVEAGTGADDVDDGVHRTDLVEVDFVAGGAVDFGLGIGEAGEDGDGVVFDGRGKVGGGDERADVGKVTVNVAFGGLHIRERGAEGAFHDGGGFEWRTRRWGV